MAQQMQGKIVGNLNVSPSEVRAFFNSIPTDSLPIINSEVEIGQLILKAPVSEESKIEAREKIEGYRQRILKGENLSVLAALYTEDPGSAKTGGRYDNIVRGQFVPEFDAVSFRLKPGEISEVFETQFGYHFLEVIARRGEVVDIRHLLIAPKITNAEVLLAKLKLDSIYEAIKSGKTTFCDAVAKYSDENETKNNCGIIVNTAKGSTRFEIEELGQIEQSLVFMLDKMSIGEVSKPLVYQTQDAKQAYRMIYLKNRIDPHKISLKEDYQRLQTMALQEKQKKTIRTWIDKKLKTMYFKIDPDFAGCKFENNWNVIN